MNLLEFSKKHEEAFLYALNYLELNDTVNLASTCKELHTSLEYRCTSLVQDKLTKAFSDQLYRGSRLEIKGCWHIVDTLNQIPIYVANNHIFAPSEKKTGGCALGTIYTKEEVRWIGKVGRQRGFVRKGLLSTRSCTKKDVNLDAIREKCAFDLYDTFSQGMFFVPNTYLSCQKVVDPFTKHHPRYGEQIFQLTTRGIHKCLRIMVEFVDGYKDFKYAKTRFEGKVWTFINFLKHFHRPPEELLTDDDRCVPLKGIMELSATARVLLADTDYLGGTLDNSGWIWEYNRQGLITGALTVKIDPGEALGFIFNDYDCYNRVFFTKEQLAPPHWRLADLKDIQVANQNHALTILWKDLTESQKKQFLDHAHNLIQQILSSDQERYHCFFRNGGFYRNSVKEMPEEIALQLSKGMKEWVELQRTIYEEGLTLRNVFFYSPKPLVNFVGREDVLSQLTAALVPVHFDPQAPAATAVVCAEGGMGKSELAAQFADLQKTIFSPIFWVNSDSPTALRNSYLALAGALKLYIEEKEDLENIREVVHKALEERNADRPYLLIFNNASDVLTLPQKGGSNLITTRRNDLWEKEIVIPLPPLSLSEASSYIEKVIGPQPSDKIAIFLEKTEGSPLALAQAAAMMKNRTIGIAEYLFEFHQFEMKELIDTNSTMIFSYFESIEPLALNWLKLCAFLHPDAISQDWLESWLEGQQATEEKTFDILLLLKEYSLIHFDFQQRTFSLHSHLQKVLPPFVSKEKASLAEQAIQLLNKRCSFDHDQFDTWGDAQAWLLHAQYFLVQEAGISSSTGMARLLCNAAKIAIEFAKRRESINLLERALAIQQTGVMNDEESAELFSLLGLALNSCYPCTPFVDNKSRKKAFKYTKRALAIRQTLYRDQPHPDLAKTLKEMAFSLYSLDRHTEAQIYTEKSLAMWHALVGDQDHPEVAMSLQCTTTSDEGILKALEMWRRLYGQQPHPDLASTLEGMGLVLGLKSQGFNDEILRYFEEALTMKQMIYGSQPHPALACSLVTFATALSWPPTTTVNEKRAHKYLNEARAMLSALENEFSPYEIACFLSTIGLTFRKFHNYAEAHDCFQEALTMMQKLFSNENHPDVVKVLGYLENAKIKLLKQLDSNSPNPDLAQLLTNKAARISNLNKAYQCEKKALDIWQKLYNNQPHFDLARSLGNMAVRSSDACRNKEALEYGKRALAMLKSLHNNQHHLDIVLMTGNIGNYLFKLKKIKKAISYHQQVVEILLETRLNEQPNFDLAHLMMRTAKCTYDQGHLTHDQQLLEGAYDFANSAINSFEELYLDQIHPEFAHTMDDVVKIFSAAGKHQAALDYAKKAQAMWQEIHHHAPHSDVARALNSVATCLCNLECYPEALEYAKQALDMQKRLDGEKYDVSQREYKKTYLEIMKKWTDKEPQKANEAASSVNDPESFFQPPIRSEAIRYIQQADHNSQTCPKLAQSWIDLGNNFQELKNYDKALNCYQEALTILEELFQNENHPEIARTKKAIEHVKHQIPTFNLSDEMAKPRNAAETMQNKHGNCLIQ